MNIFIDTSALIAIVDKEILIYSLIFSRQILIKSGAFL